MPKSPIRLKSSSKAKLRATKSPSNHNDQSQLLTDQTQLRASLHTIPVKQSPKKHRPSHSNFTQQAINYAKSQPYNNVTFRSGSPVTLRESPNRNLELSNHLSATSSYHQMVASHPPPETHVMVSPQKSILYDSIARPESVVNFVSPIKSALDNDRSFIKVVELGKKHCVNRNVVSTSTVVPSPNPVKLSTTEVVTIRPKMVSPPRLVTSTIPVNHLVQPQIVQPQIVQKVITHVSPREIELERKVKILEMRIGELYNQKTQMETQMNEANIRLQYENNFLKQKLESFTEKQKTEFHEVKDHVNEKSSRLSQKASQKLIKELQKSQENEYHQSKEIHNLRQQLLETEDMLSKEISKSLALLEELTYKEKENEELKQELKKLKDQQVLVSTERQNRQSEGQAESQEAENIGVILAEVKRKLQESECERINLELQVRELQESLENTRQQNNSYVNEIEELRKNSSETKVTVDLMHELEQNNQMLISAIRTLESSLKDNEVLVQNLQVEKEGLEQRLMQMQEESSKSQEHSQSTYEEQLSQCEEQIQMLSHKLNQTELELSQKILELSQSNTTIKDQQYQIYELSQTLKENSVMLKNKQLRIEELIKSQEEGAYSTSGSFYKKMGDTCGKCDELRKTIIKLNSHLAKSTSSIASNPKIC